MTPSHRLKEPTTNNSVTMRQAHSGKRMKSFAISSPFCIHAQLDSTQPLPAEHLYAVRRPTTREETRRCIRGCTQWQARPVRYVRLAMYAARRKTRKGKSGL